MRVSRFSRALAASVAAVALLLPATADAQRFRLFDPSTQAFIDYDDSRPAARNMMPDPQYMAQVVDFATEEAPGTVIIDTQNKFLYYVMADGLAIRYGVGVGKEGFGWNGTVRVGAKAEWPSWTPPAEMIKRRPELIQYASGMPGGADNPLGARALYLYDGGRDTMFRIHGTNEPWSIGHNVSSGCIRMLNDHVIELHRMVGVGTKVIVM
jgi:lipoprotein-anchoring transpeptidase ErfK/SrfK